MSSVSTKAQKDQKRASVRAEQLRAQKFLWFNSELPRVASCGKKPVMPGGEVVLKVTESAEGRRAGFGGLSTCGSPWACPCCSAKIAPARADEIQAIVDAWHLIGGRVVFATFTERHTKEQSLAQLWDALSAGWSKVANGKAWNREQAAYGVKMPREIKTGVKKGQWVIENRIGVIKVVEVTHGANGWHVHIHALLFVRDGINDVDVQLLGQAMFGRWVVALTDAGLAAPSQQNGVDVKLVRRFDSHQLGDYFSKVQFVGRVTDDKAGWEMAGGAGKSARGRNRTPFQILGDLTAGMDTYEEDLALWAEWETVSKGRRQLTFSAGLRAYLEMLAEEKQIEPLPAERTDEEIAAKDMGGDVVARFTAEEWRLVRRHRVAVLWAAQLGGSAGSDHLAVLLASILNGVYGGIHD